MTQEDREAIARCIEATLQAAYVTPLCSPTSAEGEALADKVRELPEVTNVTYDAEAQMVHVTVQMEPWMAAVIEGAL